MNVGQMLAAFLVGIMAFPAQAQQAPESSILRNGGRLKIFVLQGSGAQNSLRDRTTTQAVVEVRDELNQPVRGAEVSFQLPTAGPGGFFTGQKLGWTGKTDENGQVATNAFLPNDKPGKFNIQVSATYGSKVGYAFVSQTNSLAPVYEGRRGTPGGKTPGWVKAAVVIGAAAAAGGIVWGVRHGNSRPSVVLQPGAISLGGPR